MKGRRPTPTALRVLRGNPRKRPINADEPTPAPLSPTLDPPAWLADAAKDEWRRLAGVLEPLGVLTETDADALAAYCEAFVTWKQATNKLRQFGMVIKVGKTGLELPVISPYVKIAHQSMQQMRALLVEFGMTPSARARIHVTPKPPTNNKWGKLL